MNLPLANYCTRRTAAARMSACTSSIERLASITTMRSGISGGFGQEAGPQSLAEIVAVLLHSVKLALDAAGGGLGGHIEHER